MGRSGSRLELCIFSDSLTTGYFGGLEGEFEVTELRPHPSSGLVCMLPARITCFFVVA